MPVQLQIKGKNFDFFNQTVIQLKHSNIASSFKFVAFFDPENPEHKTLFKPLSYPDVKLNYIDGEGKESLLITGTILKNRFRSESMKRLAEISGYAKTGVLGDCPIPSSLYPIEFNNLSFFQICEKLCSPFDIGVTRGAGTEISDEVFPEIQSSTGKTIAKFLSETGAQKNLVLTHDESGNLRIEALTEAIKPIAAFNDSMPGVSMDLSVNGQAMHNQIAVQKQASIDTDNAADYTIDNPLVSAFRPTVKSQSSGNDNNSQDAAKNALANEVKNIVLKIEVDRWEWLNETGGIMTPNKLVSVVSPENYIFEKTNFFVEQVSLSSNEQKETASLICVLPEAYNNKTPSNIFL